METALFGAGCFWGVEEAFRRVEGVVETAAGYSGGSHDDPTYRDVCSGLTGHAEVVEIRFDRDLVSYEQLLDLFWSIHDPTLLNRQGPDVGTQYRSVIFYGSPEQDAAARASKESVQTSGRFKRPVVTEISPATTFWRAEDYHQQYIAKGGKGACSSGPPR